MNESKLGKKVVFIYNPSSGKGRVEKNLDFIVNEINKKYGSVDVIRTKSAEHLTESVRNACYEYDYLFFSGGDGTFNMVVNSIPFEVEKLPIFGYLPGGSTNDMSYNVNISRMNVKKGIVDLMNSKPKKYDIGYMGKNKFIYVACVGAFTDIPYITPQEDKRKWGGLAYLYYGLKSIFKNFKPYNITVNGIKYTTPLIIFSNSKEVASFKINPFTAQDTNKYYACIVKNGKLKGILNVCYLFAFGLEKAIKKGIVEYAEAPMFTIESDQKLWDYDGEFRECEFPTYCGYSGRSIMLLVNRE